jgi:hypothetical protein
MVRKCLIVVFPFLLFIVFFNILCTPRPDTTIRNAYGQAFAGSEACRSCHKDIYEHVTGTAHYRDSRPASRETIKGSFDSDRNVFAYHDGAKVRMEWADSGAYQASDHRRERFDIVVGSGRKGQSYLYWKGQALYQLPVSEANGIWCVSPGYPADSPFFDRRVPAACLGVYQQ